MQLEMPYGPNVWLLGDVEHCDFEESLALVHRAANVGLGPPELIVVAQSRPGVIRQGDVDRLRRAAPLAGVVSLCGSWCEGEPRTGRPLAGTTRLYWYEFPSWWRRQLTLRLAGERPEWTGSDDCGLRHPEGIRDCELGGRVAVAADRWDTFDAVAGVLRQLKWDAIWIRSVHHLSVDERVWAGIWDGGQLSDAEAGKLAAFCASMKLHGAPAIALLDFPRGERCAIAREMGAAAVLGKPWGNANLLSTLRRVIDMESWVARIA